MLKISEFCLLRQLFYILYLFQVIIQFFIFWILILFFALFILMLIAFFIIFFLLFFFLFNFLRILNSPHRFFRFNLKAFFVLFIFIEHKFEPFLFLFSFLIDLFFNFMHLLKDARIATNLIRFVQIIKSKFDVVGIFVDKLKVSLRLLIMHFCSLFDFEGLVG